MQKILRGIHVNNIPRMLIRQGGDKIFKLTKQIKREEKIQNRGGLKRCFIL